MGLSAVGGAYTMSKRFQLQNAPKLSIHYIGSLPLLPIVSQPLISVSKVEMGALTYLVPVYSKYYSCFYSLFPSQKFSCRSLLQGGGAFTRSKACVRETVGIFAGGGYRWRNMVYQPATLLLIVLLLVFHQHIVSGIHHSRAFL